MVVEEDIQITKEKANVIDMLVSASENFSFKLNEDDEKVLQDYVLELKNTSDTNLINKIKSLFWMQRALNFLDNMKNRNSRATAQEDASILSSYNSEDINLKYLNYKSAIKFSQEAISLFNFSEIKKKEYYLSLMNQTTAARNIRDVIELIKTSNSNNQTQPISEDSFERIQSEIDSCYIDLPEEKELVNKLRCEKDSIIKKFANFIEESQSLACYEKFLEELKNFGILMPKLISSLEKAITEAHALNREIKKHLDIHKQNKLVLNYDKVNLFYEKYKRLKINFDSGEILKTMIDNSNAKLEKLKNMIINVDNFDLKLNFDISEEYSNKQSGELEKLNQKNLMDFLEVKHEIDIYDINGLLNSIEVHKISEEKNIKKILWLKKYELVIEKKKYIPDLDFLKNLYNEINEISITELACFKKIESLMDVLKNCEDFVNKIFNCRDKESLQKLKIDSKTIGIDLTEFFIQQEVKIDVKGYDYLKDSIPSASDKLKSKHEKFDLKLDKLKILKNLHPYIEDNKKSGLNFKSAEINKNNSNSANFSNLSNSIISQATATEMLNKNSDINKLIINKNVLQIAEINTNRPKQNLNPLASYKYDENDFSLLGNKRRINDIIDLISNNNNNSSKINSLSINNHYNNEMLLNSQCASLSQGRSKRNINMKLDKDFYYDKEFIKNFESIQQKKFTVINSNNDQLNSTEYRTLHPVIDLTEEKAEDSTNNPLYIINNTFVNNNNNKAVNESLEISGEISDSMQEDDQGKESSKEPISNKDGFSYSYIYESEKNKDETSKKNTEIENIKKMISQGLKNPNLIRSINKSIDPLKESIRKNSNLQLTLALKENPLFIKCFGEEKIDKLAHELELKTKINHPLVNEAYQKAVETMVKVIKEINKFPNVSRLITKNRLTLDKVAFFPYGVKLIEKLKKIDAAASTKNPQKIENNKTEQKLNNNNTNNNSNKNNNNNTNSAKKGFESAFVNNKTSTAAEKQTNNNSATDRNKNLPKNKTSDQMDFLSIMNEMNEFYDSLKNSEVIKSKLGLELNNHDANKDKKTSSKMKESLINFGSVSTTALDKSLSASQDDFHMDEDEDDSLKSESDMEMIKFSPGAKEEANNLNKSN